jgi:hypothetical protein
MSKRDQLWQDLVVWLATPPSRRGAISTEEEWAEANKTTTRTMRRWKQDPEFVALQDAYQLRLDARAALEAEPELDGDATEDERSYLKVKSKLIEGAASGNPKYMDLYFKTYGKPFVEEEAAARTADLVNLDLDELILRTLSMIEQESLVRHLQGLGWVVVPPGGGDDVS